jgi:hypothetical protein
MTEQLISLFAEENAHMAHTGARHRVAPKRRAHAAA